MVKTIEFPMSDNLTPEQQVQVAFTSLTEALQEVRTELSDLREQGTRKNGRKGWETFWRILSVVLMPMIFGVVLFLLNLDNRVVRIEENRFTATQGQELEARLLAAIHLTEGRIVEQVDALSVDFARIEERADGTDDRINRLERRGGGSGEG